MSLKTVGEGLKTVGMEWKTATSHHLAEKVPYVYWDSIDGSPLYKAAKTSITFLHQLEHLSAHTSALYLLPPLLVLMSTLNEIIAQGVFTSLLPHEDKFPSEWYAVASGRLQGVFKT